LRAVGFTAASTAEGASLTMSAPHASGLSGTWRAMGNVPAVTGRYPVTLCKKVAD
jgi:hypothetical protein